MPYPTTHILISIILIEFFRKFFIKNNRKFSRYYILIAAIGAIIPDIDVAAYYILYFFGFSFDQIHRTFLHTMFVPLILLVIGLFVLKLELKNKEFGKRHINLANTFYILATMSFLHLILDSIFHGAIVPFYPFSNFPIGLNILSLFPEDLRWLIFPTLDVILLFFWLFWMEFKLKIQDYF